MVSLKEYVTEKRPYVHPPHTQAVHRSSCVSSRERSHGRESSGGTGGSRGGGGLPDDILPGLDRTHCRLCPLSLAGDGAGHRRLLCALGERESQTTLTYHFWQIPGTW